MKTATRNAARSKPARTMRLDGDILTITDGGKRDSYRLERIEDEDGSRLGFRLQKHDGACYDVDTVDARCDCIGHERHGRCKHAAAIFRLIDMRRI